MDIAVTGGAGYIGSHAVQLLLEQGHTVRVIDDLSRGHRAAVDRLAEAMRPGDRLRFFEADCTDEDAIAEILEGADAVMHFAALTYVGESVDEPLAYHRVNAGGMVAMLGACARAGVSRFIFSSTAATYGEPKTQPIAEDTLQNPINPYGASKLAAERVLRDYSAACARAGTPFAFAVLRYFNVAGADPTGVIGEWHTPETHVIPLVLEAARGVRESFTVYGRDYPTPDGTCIRDYVHVRDLVEAHAAVLAALEPADARVYNIGTGRGCSVAEIVAASERVSGRVVRAVDGERRAGDPPELVADPSRIHAEIGWRARYTDVDETIRTALAWFEANPSGYAG